MMKSWKWAIVLVMGIVMSEKCVQAASVSETFEGVNIRLQSGESLPLSSYINMVAGDEPVALITYFSFCGYCKNAIRSTQKDLDEGQAKGKVISLLLGDIDDDEDNEAGYKTMEEYQKAIETESLGKYNIYCSDSSFMRKIYTEDINGTPNTYIIYRGEVTFFVHGYVHSEVMIHDDMIIDALQSINGNETVYGHYESQSGEHKFDCGFKNGMQHGFWGKTYNGVLVSSENYREGKHHGLQRYYFSNGNLRYSEVFSEGISTGEIAVYYTSGELKAQLKENPDNPFILDYVTYYEDGSKQVISQMDANRMFQGRFTEYYPDGTVQRQCQFKDDALNGKANFFYENGQLLESGNYVMDRADGTWNIFHENGQLYQVRKWDNGKLLDIILCYDEDGNELDPGSIKDGNGIAHYYKPNGELEATVEYRNGEKVEE